MPLRSGETYKIIACPHWCKDDAFQTIFDATVGKRGLYVKELTAEQKAMLPKGAEGVAGLYIRWNDKTGTGDGLVLANDWNYELFGIGSEDFGDRSTHKWWSSRLKMLMGLMNYIDKPETFIKSLKSFHLSNPSELSTLQAAGVNPLVEVGLMAAPNILNLKINGDEVTFKPLVLVNGSPMVPLRPVLEGMGAEMDWSSETGSVIITEGENVIRLKVGAWEAIKNGEKEQLALPVLMINGRTIVPLQFASKVLGASASWNPAAQTVSISSK